MASDADTDEEQGDAFCEVCGSNQQRMVMVLCACYSPNHLVGCHTFCMAGDRWRRAGIDTEFYCHFCKEYRKRAQRAADEYVSQKRAEVLARRGKTTAEGEEMPALPALHISAVAPHLGRAEPQPTQQMRIDAAAKAAAAAAGAAGQPLSPKLPRPLLDAEAAVIPRVVRQVAAAGTVGAGGGGGGSGRGKVSGVQRKSAAAAAGGAVRDRQQQQQLLPGREAAAAGGGGGASGGIGGRGRGTMPGRRIASHPSNKFVAGLNKHKPAVVTAAAAKARDEAAPRRQQAAAAAMAAAAARQGNRQQGSSLQQSADRDQSPRQQQQQFVDRSGHAPEYRVTIGQIHIKAQVVSAGIRHTDDQAELNLVLDLVGKLKRSPEIQKLGHEDAARIFRDQILPDFVLTGDAERKELTGGLFDLDLHRTVAAYNDDADKGYKPIILEPILRSRGEIKEQLWARRRFVSLTLGNRLLVLVPSETGELLLLLPRNAADGDELVQEIVQSVLKDSKLGVTASEFEAQQQQHDDNDNVSVEVDGAPEDDQDNKDLVMQEVQQQLLGSTAAAAAAAPMQCDQQEQQRQQHDGMSNEVDEAPDDDQDNKHHVMQEMRQQLLGVAAAAAAPPRQSEQQQQQPMDLLLAGQQRQYREEEQELDYMQLDQQQQQQQEQEHVLQEDQRQQQDVPQEDDQHQQQQQQQQPDDGGMESNLPDMDLDQQQQQQQDQQQQQHAQLQQHHQQQQHDHQDKQQHDQQQQQHNEQQQQHHQQQHDQQQLQQDQQHNQQPQDQDDMTGLDAQESYCMAPDPQPAAATAAAAMQRSAQQLPQGMTQHYQRQQQQDPAATGVACLEVPNAAGAGAGGAASWGVTPAAAAAAGSSGRSGSFGSRTAVYEAVHNSSVAQVLRSSAAAAASAAAASAGSSSSGYQGLLCGKRIMPQIQDLAPMDQIRVYVAGVADQLQHETTPLFKLATAASNLGLVVNCKADAVQQLISDLKIPAAAAAAGSSYAAAYSTPPTSPGSAQTTAAATRPPAAAAATADPMMVDLTDDDESACLALCKHILLLPQHMTAAALQDMLNPVPLWRLLTAPVCVMYYCSSRGLLHYLYWLSQQQQQQQQQQDLSVEQAGLRQQSTPLQQQQQQQQGLGLQKVCPPPSTAQQSQPEEGEIVNHNDKRNNVHNNQDNTCDRTVTGSDLEQKARVGRASDRLPLDLSTFQLYSRGLTIVADSAALKSSSTNQIQQLLSLLQLCQQRQQHWWQQQQLSSLAVMPGDWQMVISKDDLDVMSDVADRWQLMEHEVGLGRVQILDDLLAPGTMCDESSDSPPALVANAVTLATQQQSLRLVIVAVPNIDHNIRQHQQQQQTTRGASASPISHGCAAGDLTAAAARVHGSAGAALLPSDKVLDKCHMDPTYRREGKRNLEAGSKEGRILAGTVNQVVLLLEMIAGGSSGSGGHEAAVGGGARSES